MLFNGEIVDVWIWDSVCILIQIRDIYDQLLDLEFEFGLVLYLLLNVLFEDVIGNGFDVIVVGGVVLVNIIDVVENDVGVLLVIFEVIDVDMVDGLDFMVKKGGVEDICFEVVVVMGINNGELGIYELCLKGD